MCSLTHVLLVFVWISGSWAREFSDDDLYAAPEVFHYDNYQTCLEKDDGVYCAVTVQLEPQNEKNTSRVWEAIEKISADKNNYRHDLLRHGICVNNLCLNKDDDNGTLKSCLDRNYAEVYRNLGLVGKILEMRCETKNDVKLITTGDVIFLCVVGLYVAFVLCVTVCLEFVKHFTKKTLDASEEKISQVTAFFKTFSITDNVALLLNRKAIENADEYMLFIQGIRFATAIGVIVTHATEVNVITPVANPSYTEELPRRFITMLLANGGMTVQVYFVISSFLLAVSFFKKLRDSDGIGLLQIGRYIIRRYIRFTPAYALIIALHSTLLIHLARGPFWDPIIGEDYRVCRRNWWHNLLYFNNYVINEGMCMFHSWYLSVDFQFVIFGLLIIWVIQKKPKRLYLISGLVIVFQVLFMFYILLWNNYEIAVVLRPELLYYFRIIYDKEWQATWTTIYSNLAGLVVGLCMGYLYVHKNKQVFTKKKYEFLWWIVSWGLMIVPLMISSLYMITPYYDHTRWFAATWGSIAKLLFAIGIGLVVLGMSQGLGGIVKTAFEWAPLHTLGQLSFGAYLVHFSVLKLSVATRQFPPFLTDFNMFSDIITNITMSFLMSGVLTVVVLMPVAHLSRKLV